MTYVATISVDGLRAESDLLNAFANGLKFPPDSGKNLDAFWDRLTDLSWIQERDIEVKVAGLDAVLGSANPTWVITFLTMLSEVCRYWDGVNGDMDPLTNAVKHRVTFIIEFQNGGKNQIGGDIWPSFGDGWTGPNVWADTKEPFAEQA